MERDTLRFAFYDEVVFQMAPLPTIIVNNLITSCASLPIATQMASIICTGGSLRSSQGPVGPLYQVTLSKLDILVKASFYDWL
jgi:hypothetical protein